MGLTELQRQLRAEEKKIRLKKVPHEGIEHAKKRLIILSKLIEAEAEKKSKIMKKKEENMRLAEMTSEEMLDLDYAQNHKGNVEKCRKAKNRNNYLKRRAATRFTQMVKKRYALEKKEVIKL